MRLAISLIAISLLLSGALGLTSMSDCAKMTRASEKMQCYHLAAVTVAYIHNLPEAQGDCVKIDSDFDTEAYAQDVRQRANLEANDCFFDIAKILGDPSTCDFIVDNKFVSGLSGARSTHDMCVQEATKIAALQPDNYFQAHPDSLCHSLFILPLVLVGAIAARKR